MAAKYVYIHCEGGKAEEADGKISNSHWFIGRVIGHVVRMEQNELLQDREGATD